MSLISNDGWSCNFRAVEKFSTGKKRKVLHEP